MSRRSLKAPPRRRCSRRTSGRDRRTGALPTLLRSGTQLRPSLAAPRPCPSPKPRPATAPMRSPGRSRRLVRDIRRANEPPDPEGFAPREPLDQVLARELPAPRHRGVVGRPWSEAAHHPVRPRHRCIEPRSPRLLHSPGGGKRGRSSREEILRRQTEGSPRAGHTAAEVESPPGGGGSVAIRSSKLVPPDETGRGIARGGDEPAYRPRSLSHLARLSCRPLRPERHA